MDYEEAIAFLRALNRFGTKLGLERMRFLLGGAGSPHEKFRSVHVAGTNGKGSVSAVLFSVLRQAGYKVGLYTSPHLSSWNERIRVNEQDIRDEDVARILGGIRPLIERTSRIADMGHPTEFEVSTLVAFIYFAEVNVDIAVIEVGLGGRLDATNVIRPLVSIITRIGLDHMDRLGGTLREIALEKAGIIKDEVPVVSSPQDPQALGAIVDTAEAHGAELFLVGRDISYERRSLGLWGQKCNLRWPGGSWDDVYLPLVGPHQASNAATAAGALLLLMKQGWKIDASAVRRGFAATRWPGRFEVIQKRPLVILDGAHNLDGVRALCAALDESLGGRKVTAVLGFSRDKDLGGIGGGLFPLCGKVIATRAASARSGTLEPEAIADEAGRYGVGAELVYDAREATRRALSLAREAGGRGPVLVAGSLYLVGEVRPLWRGLDGFPEPKGRIVIFAGGFGAGKTEVAINYALGLARRGVRVGVGDVDVVRPYFRSREVQGFLEACGVRVISSVLGRERADLPAVDPAILSLFEDDDQIAVLDVGGDEAGARILRRFGGEFRDRSYELNFVINANRPDTRDTIATLELMRRIEEGSGLAFTGIVSNAHLGDLTTPEDVERGLGIARDVALRSGVPLRFLSVEAGLLPYLDELETPILPLELFMRPPWDVDFGFVSLPVTFS